MKTSAKAIAFLEKHEGVVLKAYRCPANILTIGAGLTSASGVITVKPGLQITRDEASALLAKALARNYEPRVARAMPSAKQNEFDAGVSFDFNTGAIHRASWVGHWKRRDWAKTKTALLAWNKGGGRVLPGLVRRRQDEFDLLRGTLRLKPAPEAVIAPAKPLPDTAPARITLDLSPAEMAAIHDELAALGYSPGAPIMARAVKAFQADHDLTADGVIGRATLSTLQRRIDARRKATAIAAATPVAVASPELASATSPDLAGAILPDWILWVVLGIAGIAALRLAWSYRDVVAVKIQRRAPNLAIKLRSI